MDQESILSVDRFTTVQSTQPVSIRASYGPFSTKQTVPARFIVPDTIESQGDHTQVRNIQEKVFLLVIIKICLLNCCYDCLIIRFTSIFITHENSLQISFSVSSIVELIPSQI